ncbi:MAG: ABC transporter permease [Candidatus Velamenicoccus archaeovorus]
MSGGTRRVLLVVRREWNQRVRSLAFRLSTVLSILIIVAIVVVPEMYGAGVTPERTVGVVGETSPSLPTALRAAGDTLGISVETRRFADEAAGRAALRSDDVAVLLVDEGELLWKGEADDQLRTIVTAAVQVVEQQRAVHELGLRPDQVQRLLRPPGLDSRSLEPATEERSARVALATIGLVLLFMAISFYGGFLLVGVVEEKSSRVVEVLLSRLRPTELLAGKIAGIGLVGLAQFGAVAASALIALKLSGNTLAPSTTPSTIGWILLWFVLGYAFYSVLYAAAGSLVSRQEEAQSMTFPITAVLLVGYFFSFGALESPDGAAAVVGSLVPPTAPMVMTVRVASGAVPWWQVAVSVVLMLASIYGLVGLAGRIYTGAMLRIGRRVKLREAWRGGEASA